MEVNVEMLLPQCGCYENGGMPPSSRCLLLPRVNAEAVADDRSAATLPVFLPSTSSTINALFNFHPIKPVNTKKKYRIEYFDTCMEH